MPILRLATGRETRNPVRVQQYNATIRAGDDLKLALTVYADDVGTPAQVVGSRSQLALRPDDRGAFGHSWDYGLGWWTGATYSPGFPAQLVAGFATPVRPGGINFAMPAATTACLVYGRYRLNVQVDLPDGEYCQVEGILQVRERWERPGIGHVPATFMQLNVSNLDTSILAPALVDGRPVDLDGFFLTDATFLETAVGHWDVDTWDSGKTFV